jgi:Nucleotidyl transferase AbiEii toxin, Type IV TA system
VSELTPERAYLELQRLARAQGRNTQQLFELYIHERFLARLAESRFRERFVLKGGLLLAVMAIRRTTRDADMLAGIHPHSAVSLRDALHQVAEHRGREVRPLGPLLQTLRETRQLPWEAFRARSGLAGLPERFAEVVDAVVDFIDGVQSLDASHWDPVARRWE